MKILFLNPHIDAQHQIAKSLEQRGFAILHPMNADEAWKMVQLHGSSLELAIVHREGLKGSDEGIRFLNQLKADSAMADLPVILSSQVWSDAEFAKHQETPQGANAYLRWPYDDLNLFRMIDAVFGQFPQGEIAAGAIPTPVMEVTAPSGAAPPPRPEAGTSAITRVIESPDEFRLELTNEVFKSSDGNDGRPDAGRIDLEAPPGFDPAAATLSQMVQQGMGTSTMIAPAAEAGGTGFGLSPSGIDLPSGTGAIQLNAFDGATQAPTPTNANHSRSGINIDMISEPAAPRFEESVIGDPDLSSISVLEPEPPSMIEMAMPREAAAEPVDEEAEEEMPYLFNGPSSGASASVPPPFYQQPIGDAVVPGGAAQTPDIETLKKYLLLREQDVAALSGQLKAAQEETATLREQLRTERSRASELSHSGDEQRRRIDDFEREKALMLEGVQAELNELRFQSKSKVDKAKLLEGKVRDAGGEIEKIKERVRMDIRKIRVREKELENRLEMAKKDSEALLAAREQKIIELKRKVDLLEFNMDLLQDQYAREKDGSVKLRERLTRAAQVVRVAGGLLDQNGEPQAPTQLTGEDPAREAS